MSRPDDGLIHAWLDGELDADEAARVARLVETDAEWGAAAAEARGLIAASSRIVKALDVVPAGVIPAGSTAGGAKPRRRVVVRPWLRIAATVVIVAGVGYVANEAREPAAVAATVAATEGKVVARDVADSPATGGAAVGVPAPEQERSAAVAPASPPASPVPAEGLAAGSAGPPARAMADDQALGLRQDFAKAQVSSDSAAADVRGAAGLAASRVVVTGARTDSASRLNAALSDRVANEETERRKVADARRDATLGSLRERAEAVGTVTAAPPSAPPSAAPVAPQTAKLRPRLIIDREPSAVAETDALTPQVLAGCWRTRTTVRSDSILVDPRILSYVGDSTVILLTRAPLDVRSLVREVPSRATVVRAGLTGLRGTARGTDGAVVPFEATRTTCP